jgi:hypothetical protein
VTGASVRHVDTVLIGGKIKKWKGKLVDVDVNRVLKAGKGFARPYCSDGCGVAAVRSSQGPLITSRKPAASPRDDGRSGLTRDAIARSYER